MIPASQAASRPLATILACALIALSGLGLAACGGGDGDADAVAQTTVRSAAGSTAEPTSAPDGGAKGADAAAARNKAAAERCRDQLGGFLTAMDRLREGLAVGFSYEQYVEEVEAVRDVYDRVPVAKLGPGCLIAAGTPGEEAFGRYIAAANDWGECIDEEGCESAEVEPALRHKWKLAAHHLKEAREGLTGL